MVTVVVLWTVPPVVVGSARSIVLGGAGAVVSGWPIVEVTVEVPLQERTSAVDTTTRQRLIGVSL
jgi:hypothetical protein